MAKPKSYTLVKPIDGVFARDDGPDATFHDEDIGLVYDDNDPAVKRAVELHPEHFTQA